MLEMRTLEEQENRGRPSNGAGRICSVRAGQFMAVSAAAIGVPAAQAGGGIGAGGAAQMAVCIPIRTGSGLNAREHHMARARRVKKEREAVAWSLKVKRPPPLPCVVSLTRVAPSNGLDDDNLIGALKGCRDQVAQWLGVDDRDPRVSWVYAQKRGKWAVEISAWGQA